VLASFFDGIIEADPTVVAVVIGIIAATAITFVVLRLRRPGSGKSAR
jgi:hypothetical protein